MQNACSDSDGCSNCRYIAMLARLKQHCSKVMQKLNKREGMASVLEKIQDTYKYR